MSRTKFYEERDAGRIETVKLGSATLVVTPPRKYIAALRLATMRKAAPRLASLRPRDAMLPQLLTPQEGDPRCSNRDGKDYRSTMTKG